MEPRPPIPLGPISFQISTENALRDPIADNLIESILESIGTDTLFVKSCWVNATEMSGGRKKTVPSTVLQADCECLEGGGGIDDDMGPTPTNFMYNAGYIKGIKQDAATFLNAVDEGYSGLDSLDSTSLHPKPACGRFHFGMEETEVSDKIDAQLQSIQEQDVANQEQQSRTTFIPGNWQNLLPPPEPPLVKSALQRE